MELKKKEEIIKALECHASGKLVECEQCPLDKAHLFNATCVQAMCDNALALIKELTEEIEGLEADYDRVYEQAEADIRGNMADGGTSCHWCHDKTRADTVEKMKEVITQSKYIFSVVHYINGEEPTITYHFTNWDLRTIAKEILEGNK